MAVKFWRALVENQEGLLLEVKLLHKFEFKFCYLSQKRKNSMNLSLYKWIEQG
jgi:hypothetical protein